MNNFVNCSSRTFSEIHFSLSFRNAVVLYESLHSTAQTSEGPTQLKGQQRFNKCGILLPIVCKSEKGLRDPMPQVKRVPSTLAHIAVDLDLNDSAHLATNAAVGAFQPRSELGTSLCCR